MWVGLAEKLNSTAALIHLQDGLSVNSVYPLVKLAGYTASALIC